MAPTGAAVVFVALAVGSLAAADVNVTVQSDATYAVDTSHAAACTGTGDSPAGSACPRKGEVAIGDCHSSLPTFNGTNCVAPVDAECVVDLNSKWGCAFPEDEGSASVDLTSTLTITRDSSFEESPWGDPHGELLLQQTPCQFRFKRITFQQNSGPASQDQAHANNLPTTAIVDAPRFN
jgi:hypothetical protein